MLSKLCHNEMCRCAEGGYQEGVKGGRGQDTWTQTLHSHGGRAAESLTQGTWSRIGVPSGASPSPDRGTQEPVSPHPTENCFMHQAQEEVSEKERLEKACEPGVDYGECDSCRLCHTVWSERWGGVTVCD